eukprot:CAMPEP_0118671684 /NCGR_PEP_ID=MMETSP0785-20121206/22133_1 /TAXON_ID=91992 /ORGANISM="Bolidomonas pacifica, Strain CCMP 1866" /LENGTH=377 /DNA_ID=CAMNT_0006566585 /DNA_START=186 /DNA_END=1321 /DNA_ORIENTATION=+
MEAGVIGKWNFEEGQSFSAGDSLAEIETDKATIDFESQDDGVLAKIIVEAGKEIPCGTPIAISVDEEEDAAAFKDYIHEGASSPASPTSSQPSTPPPSSPTPPPPPPPANPTTTTTATATQSGTRIIASPLAKKLALDSGVPLGMVVGTGPNGRIIADDVRSYVPGSAPSGAPTTSSSVVSGSGDWAKHAADAIASKRNVPHYYLTVTVDVTRLLQDDEEDGGIAVTDFALMAAGRAMSRVPSVNGSWLPDGSGVRIYDDVDVNVLCGSGEGSYRTVVEQTKTMEPTADIGTFSLVNLGMYGVKTAAPVIIEPQSCILALGSITPTVKPGDSDGEYKYGKEMEVTMSCDHRVVDGAVGAEWLQAFKEGMEKPESMLL